MSSLVLLIGALGQINRFSQIFLKQIMGFSKSMKLNLSDISCKKKEKRLYILINEDKHHVKLVFTSLQHCIFTQRVPLTRLPYLRVTRVRKAIEEDDRASGSKRCGLIQQLLFFCQSHSYHTYHMQIHHHTICQPRSGSKFQSYLRSSEKIPRLILHVLP